MADNDDNIDDKNDNDNDGKQSKAKQENSNQPRSQLLRGSVRSIASVRFGSVRFQNLISEFKIRIHKSESRITRIK